MEGCVVRAGQLHFGNDATRRAGPRRIPSRGARADVALLAYAFAGAGRPDWRPWDCASPRGGGRPTPAAPLRAARALPPPRGRCRRVGQHPSRLPGRHAADPKARAPFQPLPMGRFDWVRTLAVNIALAQPLAPEYAELLGGRDDDDLLGLADSFAFASCGVPETRDQLAWS